MYKLLTSYFDCYISESKVSRMDNKVRSYIDKVVSKLQLSSQFIQTKPTQSNTQQFCSPIQPIESITTPLKYLTQSITTLLKHSTQFIKIPLKQSNTQYFFTSSSLPNPFRCISSVDFAYYYPITPYLIIVSN